MRLFKGGSRGWRPVNIGLALVIVGLLATSLTAVAAPGSSKSPAKTSSATQRGSVSAAAQWRLRRLQDEKGNIPANAVIQAKAQINAMAKRPTRLAVSGRGAGIMTTTWTSVGPTTIGGRIRSIVIDPNTPANMWVGSVSGGIWKSSDAGASWQPQDDFMADLGIGTMAISPVDSNVLYAGTGERFGAFPNTLGAGIFKTTDGGAHWNQLSATAPTGLNAADWRYVSRIAISPDGQTILAATITGIQRSSDGGQSWTQVYNGGEVNQVLFSPASSQNAIAGTPDGKALYSSDGGQTWTQANPTTWPATVELAYSASNPQIVYASVDLNKGEIWRSSDGGHNFAQVNTGDQFLGTQGGYGNTLWVDPTDPNSLLVGGLTFWRGVYDSGTGKVTLTNISQDGGVQPYTSAHVDEHIIINHPGFVNGSNKTVYVGTDGGIFSTADYKTTTATSGWVSLNNGLAITQFYGGAGSAASGKIIAGAQDNSVDVYSGNPALWKELLAGDGGKVAADPTDPNYLYGETQNLNLVRSSDGGQTAQGITAGIADVQNGATPFVAPILLDPNNTSTFYAGAKSLWRSSNIKDATPTWTAVKAPVGTNCSEGSSPDCVSAIAVAKGNSDIIWVGYENGTLAYTTNGTQASPTWTTVAASAGLPSRVISQITVDPTNAQQVYVSYGGFFSKSYTPNNLWRTQDGGATWTALPGTGANSLPAIPIYSLAISPVHSTWLYAGTEMGVFTSEDGGANWFAPSDGPANVPVFELFWIDNNTLGAATFGRSAFKTTPVTQTQPPAISGFYPASAQAGGSSFNLTITGTNFVSGAVASFGGTNLTTNFVSSTQLVALVPDTALASAGPVNVVVTNPSNQASAPQVYNISASCNPLVVSHTANDQSCGSLATAIMTASFGNNKTVTFMPLNPGTISLAGTLTLPANLNLQGVCGKNGPAITLSGSGVSGDGLVLSNGGIQLYGLKISGFSGRQLVANGGNNRLGCVVASKA